MIDVSLLHTILLDADDNDEHWDTGNDSRSQNHSGHGSVFGRFVSIRTRAFDRNLINYLAIQEPLERNSHLLSPYIKLWLVLVIKFTWVLKQVKQTWFWWTAFDIFNGRLINILQVTMNPRSGSREHNSLRRERGFEEEMNFRWKNWTDVRAKVVLSHIFIALHVLVVNATVKLWAFANTQRQFPVVVDVEVIAVDACSLLFILIKRLPLIHAVNKNSISRSPFEICGIDECRQQINYVKHLIRHSLL